MKSSIRIIASCLMLSLLLVVFSACSATPAEALKKIATETSAKCPIVMDEYTTMTNCEYKHENGVHTLVYTYAVGDKFAGIDVELLAPNLKNLLLEKTRVKQERDFYVANKVEFEHIYLHYPSDDRKPVEVVVVKIKSGEY